MPPHPGRSRTGEAATPAFITQTASTGRLFRRGGRRVNYGSPASCSAVRNSVYPIVAKQAHPEPAEVVSDSPESLSWPDVQSKSRTCPASRAPGRIRTCDARLRSPALYPLSYEGGDCRTSLRLARWRVVRAEIRSATATAPRAEGNAGAGRPVAERLRPPSGSGRRPAGRRLTRRRRACRAIEDALGRIARQQEPSARSCCDRLVTTQRAVGVVDDSRASERASVDPGHDDSIDPGVVKHDVRSEMPLVEVRLAHRRRQRSDARGREHVRREFGVRVGRRRMARQRRAFADGRRREIGQPLTARDSQAVSSWRKQPQLSARREARETSGSTLAATRGAAPDDRLPRTALRGHRGRYWRRARRRQRDHDRQADPGSAESWGASGWRSQEHRRRQRPDSRSPVGFHSRSRTAYANMLRVPMTLR